MRISILFIITFLFLPIHTEAQKLSKSEQLVYELIESGFLKRYKKYKADAEKHVALLKLQEDSITETDKIEIKAAYAASQTAFHDFLYSVRNDLLDAKKRRYIRKQTELYVETKLLEVDEIYRQVYLKQFHPFYMQLCHPKMASRRTIDPSVMVPMLVGLLPTITSTFTKIADYFENNKAEKLEAFKKLLDEQWVQPHLFQDWEQI